MLNVLNEPPTFGLVVIGALGYMGWRPFNAPKPASRKATDPLPQTMMDIVRERHGSVIALIDPKFVDQPPHWPPDCQAQIIHYLQQGLGTTPPCVRDLAAAKDLIRTFSHEYSRTPIIVYDASPPSRHILHLRELKPYNVFYVGEKPLVHNASKLEELRQIGHENVFCDFIETVNPVLEYTKHYLVRNKCQVTQMRFWRAGASGLKHAIWADRYGVQGGALLDKAAHDLSITVALLEPEALGSPQPADVEAKVHQLILAYQDPKETGGAINQGEPLFLTTTGNRELDVHADLTGPDTKLAADGVTSFRVNWPIRAPEKSRLLLGNRTHIEVDYLFSWLGYTGWHDHSKATEAERSFVDHLHSLGLEDHDWLMPPHKEEPSKGPAKESYPPHYGDMIPDNATHGCKDDQVRVGIVECNDRTLVCNFYSNPEDRGFSALHVIHHWGRRKRQMAREQRHEVFPIDRKGQSYAQVKGGDIREVLLRVLDYALAPAEQARYLQKEAAILVHSTLIAAQEKAYEDLNNPHFDADVCDTWRKKALPIYDRSIWRLP